MRSMYGLQREETEDRDITVVQPRGCENFN